MRAYGVSVEKVEEALKAIEYPGVAIGPDHLQHVPPAAGRAVLPAGGGARRGRDRARPARIRPADGEVRARHALRRRRPPGLQPPRRELRRRRDLLRRGLRDRARGGRGAPSARAAEEATLAQLALRWILDFDAVSTTIPGAKTPEQARANAAAAELPAAAAGDARRDRGRLPAAHRPAGAPALVAAPAAATAERISVLPDDGRAARCQDRRRRGNNACEIYRDLLYTNVELVIWKVPDRDAVSSGTAGRFDRDEIEAKRRRRDGSRRA